jgi:hypothetical protein
MSEIREIVPVAVEASEDLSRVLLDLAQAVKDGQYVAGAFVVWDMRGAARTVYSTEHGPFAHSMVPAFVHDALNRHLAVVIAQENMAEPIGEDA